jgi:hypothetical protein
MLGHDERSQPRRPRPALVRLDDLLDDLVRDRLVERSAVGELPKQCGCRHPELTGELAHGERRVAGTEQRRGDRRSQAVDHRP